MDLNACFFKIIDIGNEDICKALPLLMTAYTFNYARGKIDLVNSFLRAPCNSWKSIYSPSGGNDSLIDEKERTNLLKIYSGAYSVKNKDIENITENDLKGIGKLLSDFEEIPASSLENYVKSFFFPQLQFIVLNSDKNWPISEYTYIIPEDGVNQFERRVRLEDAPAIIDDNGKVHSSKEKVYPFKRFECGFEKCHIPYEFIKEDFQTTGYLWMLAVDEMAEKFSDPKSGFACKPDLHMCEAIFSELLNENIDTASIYKLDRSEIRKRLDEIANEYGVYHVEHGEKTHMDFCVKPPVIEDSSEQIITKREEFLDWIENHLPWKEYIMMIQPFFSKKMRTKKRYHIETLLRMYLLQEFYSLNSEETFEAVIDSRSFLSFCGIDSIGQVPDSCALDHFRNMMTEKGLQAKLMDEFKKQGFILSKGTIKEPTCVKRPSSQNKR